MPLLSSRQSSQHGDAVLPTANTPTPKHLTDLRGEQSKANNIREEAGGHQERPGDENHRTVSEMTSGEPRFVELPLNVGENTPALPGYEVGTDDGSEEHDRHRGPEPDLSANQDEQPDLDRGNQNECEK